MDNPIVVYAKTAQALCSIYKTQRLGDLSNNEIDLLNKMEHNLTVAEGNLAKVLAKHIDRIVTAEGQ